MKELVSKIRKFFKQLHPVKVRKAIHYQKSRSSGGHVQVNMHVNQYIEQLIRLTETPEDNFSIRSNQKHERSYLNVPLSEARFLEVLMKALGAKHALEIGTFRGFSTAFIARGLAKDGKVFACDEDARPVPFARRFWQAMGVEEKIHFELGMAKGVLEKLTKDEPTLEFFDVVFIDADKENYKEYTLEAWKLLRPGGTLLVDNTLNKGLVRYEESGDNSAEHIKEFNTWIFETFQKQVSLLPAWDGLTMVVKAEHISEEN